MLTINGTKVKVPSSLTVNYMDITKAERNAKGTMFIELIAKKHKLEIEWSYLTQSEAKTILDALEAKITFEVSFIDPKTGSSKKATFYKGDRAIPMVNYIDDQPKWSFNVNLVEV